MQKLFFAAVAAAALITAGPAAAATLIVEASGPTFGLDPHDRLGLGGGEFFDQTFTLSFVFDLDAADRFMSTVNDTARSGSATGFPSSILASITIGGQLFTFSANFDNVALQGPAAIQQVLNSTTQQFLIGSADGPDPFIADLTAPPAGNLCLVANCYGTATLSGGLVAILNPTTYTVTYDPDGTGGGGTVPEPSTWALMILGFGSAGAMLRRRQRGSGAPLPA